MDKLLINGGKALNGCLEINSAKNAFLPILAGTILCEGEVTLFNTPKFEDIESMCNILETLKIKKTKQDDTLILDAKNADGWEIPEHQTKLIRSSIFSLGAILSRFKKAKVAYPGGCAIGKRPIDLHIKGLKELNVLVDENEGFLVCDGKNMKSGNVHLDFPSVGATENIMLAATKLKGTTKIFNAAKEPEIVDLQNFLNSMGAKISGAGSEVILVEGVKKLCSTKYKTIPDRIITGTFIIACAMAGGKIILKNANANHLDILIKKMNNCACKIEVQNDKIIVEANGKPKAIKLIETKPYPGFATDLQPQIIALSCLSRGKTTVVENLFETRFKHIPELIKMGANIKVFDNKAIIKGQKQLKPAQLESFDLRGGACLVLAAVATKGLSVVTNVNHIDRGYENIENMFSSLGVDIKRIIDAKENQKVDCLC